MFVRERVVKDWYVETSLDQNTSDITVYLLQELNNVKNLEFAKSCISARRNSDQPPAGVCPSQLVYVGSNPLVDSLQASSWGLVAHL